MRLCERSIEGDERMEKRKNVSIRMSCLFCVEAFAGSVTREKDESWIESGMGRGAMDVGDG